MACRQRKLCEHLSHQQNFFKNKRKSQVFEPQANTDVIVPVFGLPILDNVARNDRYKDLLKMLSFDKNATASNCKLREGTLFIGFNRSPKMLPAIVFPDSIAKASKQYGELVIFARQQNWQIGKFKLTRDLECQKISTGDRVIYLVPSRYLMAGDALKSGYTPDQASNNENTYKSFRK